MGDQPFSVYFHLETTCGKSKLFVQDEDQVTDMYAVSYCLIIYFRQSFSLNKIAIVRSFNDSLEELADISSVPHKMLEFRDSVTTSQLLSCIQNVAAKKTHHALIEMFCCELKFLVDICKKFIRDKFNTSLELSFEAKKKFREHSQLNFDNLCCICSFELGVGKKYGPNSDKMTYCDFVIKKEYHFLQNIFSKEELEMPESIHNLEAYYSFLKNFITFALIFL